LRWLWLLARRRKRLLLLPRLPLRLPLLPKPLRLLLPRLPRLRPLTPLLLRLLPRLRPNLPSKSQAQASSLD